MKIRYFFRLLFNARFSRDALKRRRARYRLAYHLTRRLGFRLYSPNLVWVDDESYRDAWRQFSPGDHTILDRSYVLYSMAKSAASLPGDTVECGVWKGGGSHLICLANRNKPQYIHHVFDSFEGLSQPGEFDIPSSEITHRWQAHDLAVQQDIVEENLSRFDFVQFYPGWIPERFAEVSEKLFSFVHVDVDLYQPTYDSLNFFYDRLVPGGILLCDDYGAANCPGAKRAFDEIIRDKPEQSVIHLTTGQGFIVKR